MCILNQPADDVTILVLLNKQHEDYMSIPPSREIKILHVCTIPQYCHNKYHFLYFIF
jgi:hypothetical protein